MLDIRKTASGNYEVAALGGFYVFPTYVQALVFRLTGVIV